MSWLLKAEIEKDPAAPTKDIAWEQESRLMIVAGRYVAQALVAFDALLTNLVIPPVLFWQIPYTT